jgi:glutamate dehydrogenase
MSIQFNRSLLSKEGFFISIEDKDIKLPNGEVVESGLNFRNNFHVHPLVKCDLFVPCGGRPEAINISNVNSLFIDGKPMFKYVVEGANLFFTQEARLKLEDAGVVIFKDASANKGGVTSSSMEVLAALCLNNAEFDTHMCVKNGVVPDFYKNYVQDVQSRIEENARQEFECLWREHEATGMKRSILTDVISVRINELNMQIRASGLWNDVKLRMKVLAEVLPSTLQKLLSPAEVMKRLPESYTIALLSAYLAATYVYEQGTAPNEFTFYQYMTKYSK